MTALREVAVVGAGAAGLHAAEALRRAGYDGRLTLVGAEPEPPYDRPPLSKHLLGGAWQPDRLALRGPDALHELDLDLRLGVRAERLDRQARTVHLADGGRLRCDAVILATGVRARRLPGATEPLAGAHVLRTVSDALALREELRPGVRLLVVGGGLLGAEAAATAVGLGAEVTWLVSTATPLAAVLGAQTAALLTGLHREHGVRIRQGVAAAVTQQGGRATGVQLVDGSQLAADAVLMAVGSEPETGWLADSGVPLEDGVACDAYCAAGPGVWAAGDAAAWPEPGTGRRRRLEQRTNATEQAATAARNLLAGPDGVRRPYEPVPYLWTDQYELRVQAYGHPGGADRFELVEGSLTERRFAAVCVREGLVRGAVGIGAARALRGLRAQVAAASPWPAAG
ncbi:NAD(P)/FAD-dependent oxidoreductase [Kitasatospora kifunensis]|uniref:3-phenylpropionate/trans-cinnamate dioxygenase ferredoxin reductase subunit n=1 Tax=Kitasatospora kifunensis TaxID=58351 RepID=A0A7W7VT51_KITKI|nr:FAD-dependent oxidoreductase [Kitasatospora kifunensis]MBB4921314.1 3-phenylpropionate/trans-cinnamate dioxygenase ferredoxin reductase subunit [Kitasatospora kifunensis]